MAKPLRVFPSPISGYELDSSMGYFSVVIPEASINLISNPSFEFSTTGFTALLTASISSDSTYARRGIRSMKVVPQAASEGVKKTISSGLTINGDYCWSFDLKVPNGKQVRSSVTLNGTSTVLKVITGDGKWHRYWSTFRYVTGTTELVLTNLYSIFTFYTDGWQLEEKSYPTTYLDGDMTGYVANQKAFYWNGIAHASTSTRIAATAAGGVEKKLIDIGFHLLSYTGLGMPEIENIATDLWQGGSFYQRTIEKNRTFSLIGAIFGRNTNDLNRVRRELVDAFYDRRLDIDQPVLLRYYPADGDEEDVINIPSFYNSGLQGNIDNKYQERIAITFTQFKPFMTTESFKCYPLSIMNALRGNTVFKRKSTGEWVKFISDATPPSSARVFVDRGRSIVYICGTFTDLNGVTGATGIAKYVDDQITALGTGAPGGSVSDCFIDTNGDLYVCGTFSSAGGVAKTNRIAKWNYALQAWESLYTGADPDNKVWGITKDGGGYIFAIGQFTSISGVAAAGIAKRDTSGTWTAIGTGFDYDAYDILTDWNGRVYVSGLFTAADGVTTGHVARVTASRTSFEVLVSGIAPSGVIGNSKMMIGIDGNLYICSDASINYGSFSSLVARYNGTNYYPLQGNLTGANDILVLSKNANGTIVIGGTDFYLSEIYTARAGFYYYRNGKWFPWEVEEPIAVALGASQPTTWEYTPSNDILISIWGADRIALAGGTNIDNTIGKTRETQIIFYGPLSIVSMTNNASLDTIRFSSMKVYEGETVVLTTSGTSWNIYSTLQRDLTQYVDKTTKGFGLVSGDNYITVVAEYGFCLLQNLITLTAVPYISNVSDRNSDNGKLYFKVVYSAPNHTVEIYKDSARTDKVAESASFTAVGPVVVTEFGGSGLYGFLNVFGGVPGAAVPDAGYCKWGYINFKFSKETLDLVK